MADETYILLLSGPLATHRQAVDAIRSAGFGLIPHEPRRHTYGYPHTPEGEEDLSVGFVPVRVSHPDDLSKLLSNGDKQVGQLAGLGWAQRGYWPEPPPQPEIEVVPAGTLDRLDRLEKALTDRGVI